MDLKYELIIIGGGPAGVAAGVYAARKKLKTLFVTYSFDSQSVVSPDIQNWIGTISIAGPTFAKNMEAHLRSYEGDSLTIKTGSKIVEAKKDGDLFYITTDEGEKFTSKALLVTTGSVRRKLDIKGADIYEHKGLTYCATCDGPLFDGQDVAVIGGGNAAFETAAQLAAYCKSVTLIHRSQKFRADAVTVEKVLAKSNVKAITEIELLEVKGEKFVTGLVYKNDKGEEVTLPVTGIFVEIGLLPNTGFLKGLIDLTETGQIKVDPRTQKTSMNGIWAAGDATDGLYHQNNIAAGDAVKALEDIYLELNTK